MGATRLQSQVPGHHSDRDRRRLLARVIAGRLDCQLDAGLREFARAEGVWPLLLWMSAGVGPLRAEAALALARRARLSRVLDLLAAERITAIVFKGAHLAYAGYPDPTLRPHVDTDLLIHPRDADAARRVFERSGHRLIPHVTGRYVMSQFHYVDSHVPRGGGAGLGGPREPTRLAGYGGPRHSNNAGAHTYDVHWQVANPAVFRDLLPFDEVRAHAIPLEPFGAHGLCPSLPHALIIACIHRAAHHGATERLIWLTDLRLMLRAAGPAGIDEFCRRADAAGLNAVCHDACARAADLFGDVTVPAPLRARAAAANEATRAYLRAPSRIEEMWLDLRAIGGWRARTVLLREHLFPPAAYMREIFGAQTPLPWGYAVRMVRGAIQLFTPKS